MGASPSEFKDGDIPREHLPLFFNDSRGYAYYSSSVTGNCSGCGEQTNMWMVTIKSKGVYLCEVCRITKAYIPKMAH